MNYTSDRTHIWHFEILLSAIFGQPDQICVDRFHSDLASLFGIVADCSKSITLPANGRASDAPAARPQKQSDPLVHDRNRHGSVF